VQSAIDAAYAQYANLDVDGFRASADRAQSLLPCVTDPVSRHLAAEVHRLAGLRGFVDRDPDASTRAFAAARSIEPAYAFPTTLVPPGNPALADYTAIDPASGRTTPLPPPKSGHVQLDGTASTARSTSFPTVFQHLGDDGAVRATSYLLPSAPVPPYEIAATAVQDSALTSAPPGPPPTSAQAPPTPKSRRLRAPLAIGAVGLGAVSGVAYFRAGSAEVAYWETDGLVDDTAIEAQRRRVNGLLATSAVAGGVAVGLGVGAMLVAEF
jgi:hypothetical protein